MLSFSRSFRLASFTAALLVCARSSGQAAPPTGAARFDGLPFTSSVEDLRSAAAAVAVDPAFDTQILLEEGSYVFAADGTKTYQHRLIYRVDTKAGLEGWSEVSATWEPWFEKPAQLWARILQADGRFLELDQKTITDAPVKAEDHETYDSSRERRAPLPGLAVGSIVEEVVTVEEKTPYFAGGGNYRFNFRSGTPMARERLTVNLPSTMPFLDKIQGLPDLLVARSEAGGRRRVVYEATGLAAAHDSDIDLRTNAPGKPMVQFATGASWGAVASAYAALSDPQTSAGDVTAVLPEGLPQNRVARVREIVAKLHREVRYTGVEFGDAKLTPQRPAEVLKRHYGDCKDKATLLVAMLRAAKIPAHLALLATGPGQDVEAGLPGMTQFDHAIAYVPAEGAEPAIWIDATAQYFVPGSLPYMDEGRMALVIAPETTGLTRTPEPKPEDSQLVETRTFTLSQFGPARVVESSETHGVIDADYRSSYTDTTNTKVRQDLERYIEAAYLGKALTNVSHGVAADVAQPFNLKMEVEGAKRGTTGLDEALVAIFPSFVLDSLPSWFKTQPKVAGADTPAQEKREMEMAQASRVGTYVFRPFVDERRVRVAIPDGFAVRALPVNKTTAIGQGGLTESYSSAEPGFITATYHFNTGPGALTAEQALAMRTAALELLSREYVGIFLDQVGSKALAKGEIRTALEADRAVIAAHPKDALAHTRLAGVLLQAGIGSEAQAEAKRATEVDPKLAIAFGRLAWTLQHDSLGVRFGPGYDLPGAIAAYKKAIALDPEFDDARYDLAILYEFDAHGARYTDQANRPAAIAMYQELIKRNKERNASAAAQYQENLLYALLYGKQYGELEKLLATMPTAQAHAAIAIAAASAQHGAEAGVAQADHANMGASQRSKALVSAGSLLAQMRMYQVAAAVLQAGVSGAEDAPTVARQIEMYREVHPVSLEPLAATDPAAPVQRILFGSLAGTLTAPVAEGSLAHHAYLSSAEMERDVKKNLAQEEAMRVIAQRSGLTELLLLDLVTGRITFKASGDDATGHPVLTTTRQQTSNYFVVREDGTYRVVAEDRDQVQVGAETLYLLEHNNAGGAKALLDWKRDLTHKAGQDDALAGPLLPRFWTVGSTKEGADSPAAMRLAAISLLAGAMSAGPYVAEVTAAREKANGQRQTDLDLLLTTLAVGAEQPAVSLPAALRLLEQEPDSLTALSLAGASYAMAGDAKGWLAMLAPRLAKRPMDHDLLTQKARAEELAHDYAGARVALQAAIDSGKATAGDYNGFAWVGVLDGHVGEKELKAAQDSNMMSKNASFGDLHTLACVYAMEGRTTEARQVLSQSMSVGNLAKPNSQVWFALGLIYEQYGAKEAAAAAYRKVQAHEDDDHTFLDPASTYLIAQTRLKGLGVSP